MADRGGSRSQIYGVRWPMTREANGQPETTEGVRCSSLTRVKQEAKIMTFVESSARGNAIVSFVALLAAAIAILSPAPAEAARPSQWLCRHQRQYESRARHLLSGHPGRAGARSDQHPRLPRGLHLVRRHLPGHPRLDALDLSSGMVSRLLLRAARLRAATRFSRRFLRHWTLLG